MTQYNQDTTFFRRDVHFKDIIVDGFGDNVGSINLNGSVITQWPSGGSGGGNWGSITGTLSNQLDLTNALNLKANSSDLNTENWNSVHSTVQSNSATIWNYQGTDIKALSANWQNTSTVVQDNSAKWILSGTDVNLGSIPTLSGNWNSTYDTVNSLSGNWDNTYTTFSANSASYATTGSLSATYAKLDGMNQPFLGSLNVSALSAEIRLSDGDYSRLVRKSDGNTLNLYSKIYQQGSNSYALDASSASNYSATGTITANTGAFTMSMWVYRYGNCIDNYILADVGNFSLSTGYGIYTSSVNKVIVKVNNKVTTFNYTIPLSTWTLLTVTRSGIGVTDTSLYVDGTFHSTVDTSTAGNPTSSTDLYIFKRPDGAWYQKNIKIDELLVFNRALSSGEISIIYNGGSGIIGDVSASPWNTGLLAGYHFNDGTGITLTAFAGSDLTANSASIWTSGFVPVVGTTNEVNIIQASNSVYTNETSRILLGNYSTIFGSKNTYEGLSHNFNILGSEKAQLNSTSLSQTVPHIITGSSDTAQLKIVANSVQTSNLHNYLASDGTTVITSIDGVGRLSLPYYVSATANPKSSLTIGNPTVVANGYGATLKMQGGIALQKVANTNTVYMFSTWDAIGGLCNRIYTGAGAASEGTTLAISNVSPNGNVDIVVTAPSSTEKVGLRVAHDVIMAYNETATAVVTRVDRVNERMGIGTNAPANKLHVISTTEQLRLGYDVSNYKSETVSSTGTVTTALVGTTPINIFSQAIRGNGGYQSSDGTAGLSETKIFNDGAVVNTVVIKNGLITSWTQV